MSEAQYTSETEFRTVDWLDGYRFGSNGKVQTLSRSGCEWKTVHPCKTAKGYTVTSVNVDGKRKRFYIHRLIAEAFFGPCPSGMVCCHKDGNPSNNCVSNLRWGTSKSNSSEMVQHGRAGRYRGNIHHKTKLTDHEVRLVRKLRETGETYAAIAKRINLSVSSVCMICTRKRWKHVA
jgi:hypothetical protein